MTQHATRCPHCQTLFQVSELQLTKANGLVRCGACLHIFNAAEHPVKLTDEEAEAEGFAPFDSDGDLLLDIASMHAELRAENRAVLSGGSGAAADEAGEREEDDTRETDAFELPADLREDFLLSTAPRRRHNGLWFLLSLIAGTVLAAQYAYHTPNALAGTPYRPWLEQACEQLPHCRLPQPSDLGRIASRDLVVKSHPQRADALMVDAILTNRADFSQAFPAIELSFSDQQGRVVAARRFQPAEYLSGELRGHTTIPVRQPVHISLEIVDPGQVASSYQLRILPASAG